jgi:cytochrome b561
MQWRNTSSSYGLLSKMLHWLIVVGIVAQYFLAEAARNKTGCHRVHSLPATFTFRSALPFSFSH